MKYALTHSERHFIQKYYESTDLQVLHWWDPTLLWRKEQMSLLWIHSNPLQVKFWQNNKQLEEDATLSFILTYLISEL